MHDLGSYFTRTHQIFSASAKVLGKTYLHKLWNRSEREIYRWGADPDHCQDTAKNPLDLLRIQLERLQEVRRDDIVQAAATILFAPLGYSVQPTDIHSDRGTPEAEFLDVSAEMGKLADVLRISLADDRIDADERMALTEQANRLIQQCEELKDAVRINAHK